MRCSFLIYVVIDIAKTNHYASIVNYLTGEAIESPFLVTNNKQDFELLESQIKDIEKQVSAFIKKSDNVIPSILGIGDMTVAIIISKIGDIYCFNNPGQVLAFADLLNSLALLMLLLLE